jgi:hypothetical protein
MRGSTTPERLLSIAFVLVIAFVNFLAFVNPSNEKILQAALGIDAGVVTGFMALQTQRSDN